MEYYHLSGDGEYVIPELVKRSIPYLDFNIDVDPDEPDFRVDDTKHVTVPEFFESGFSDVYHYHDDEGNTYAWYEVPDELREDAIEQFRGMLIGEMYRLKIELFHEHSDDSSHLYILVDDGALGYVEVMEVWHGRDQGL